MSDLDLEELAGYTWMQSRIPALDGLVTFVPDGVRDPEINSFTTSRPSRWYPVDGGFRAVVPYEGGLEYDAERWHVEKGAWDHEHCKLCGANIPPMTLCWVTETGPYIILCEECHAKVAAVADEAGN
jgi:hypothetical protein